MTLLRTVLLALALLIAAPSLAQARLSSDQAQLDFAVARGKLIYAYDQAAWHTTDVLREALPRARHGEVKGWLVEPDGDALSVLYYGYEGDTPYGVFVARFKDGKVIAGREVAPDAPRGLTPVQQRMVAARKAAMAAGLAPCARALFNTVIVPPESLSAPVDVYLLTPQVRDGQYPFGGHYRVTVSPDGVVTGSRAFTRSCISMEGGDNLAGMMITHLLDPIPTEIHVWLSAWTGVRVHVVTGEKDRWKVTPDAIRPGVQ